MVKQQEEEYLDVLTPTGEKTGISKPRSLVHRDGDYHRGVHVWIYSEGTGELLLQHRGDCRKWDISAAGHVSAGESSLFSAMRELKEELGIRLPGDAFELLFVLLQQLVLHNGAMINNEYDDVYLVTTLAPIPMEAFTLEENKVLSVRYMRIDEYRSALTRGDEEYIAWKVDEPMGQLFTIIEERYRENLKLRSLSLQKQINRYARIPVETELMGLPEGDREALVYILKASIIVDNIFHEQVWDSNPALRDWLKERSNASSINRLKWLYYSINKSPWSCLDGNKSFLTTADSAVKLVTDATRPVLGWKGLEYKVAFPVIKPPGANFYPPDMDKKDFESWKGSLDEAGQKMAIGSFSVIRRDGLESLNNSDGLCIVPFSEVYKSSLEKAAEFLLKASELSDTPSLKLLLKAKADAFLSNNYYESNIAWMDLDSKLDVIIGPYEAYEDSLFGYKCCRVIGPHSVVLPNGQPSTVQLELLEADLVLEEAKADVVGLWALKYLIDRGLLSKSLLKSMYVSFLAGCLHSIRFGLEEDHGKGQALQFNWLCDKGAFILHPDGAFSVDFTKIEAAVESLCRVILTVQAEGDRVGAKSLIDRYAEMTQPLIKKLENVQVPVDIAPIFTVANNMLENTS